MWKNFSVCNPSASPFIDSRRLSSRKHLHRGQTRQQLKCSKDCGLKVTAGQQHNDWYYKRQGCGREADGLSFPLYRLNRKIQLVISFLLIGFCWGFDPDLCFCSLSVSLAPPTLTAFDKWRHRHRLAISRNTAPAPARDTKYVSL